MTRNILSLIVLATFAGGAALKADPTPAPDRTSTRTAKTARNEKSQARTDAISKTAPTPSSATGWNYVKGEWVHPDGYKYVKGQVVRTGAQTHKSPPKPPSKALLDSVKTRPAPSPDPNSAAAKAAQKERNLTPRPAPQTGSHL
jgi:hypothetical protein